MDDHAEPFDRLSVHEIICADRYTTINKSLDTLGGQLRLIVRGIIGLVAALVCWMAAQLYALEPLRIAAAHGAPSPAADSGRR